MSILIVGGAGYIGSHVNKYLHRAGYDTVVVDNLCKGHIESVCCGEFFCGDIGDEAFMDRVFSSCKIEAVMHFAAYAYVGESVISPSEYYENNVIKTKLLLDSMRRNSVNNFIFSSTCATFGNATEIPITETHPQNPINPYGFTKFVVERMLYDYDNAYGLRSCIFRYFNASGADPECEIGEWHEPETHLIPIIFEAATGKRAAVSIFGTDYPTTDGTCVRDYIHVCDLAEAHKLGMERLIKTGVSENYNLGCGKGYSVRETINMASEITGVNIATIETERRKGDPPTLIGAMQKAEKLLNWKPKYSLKDSIETAWNWYVKKEKLEKK
ncbi:MAG: UDP-glucose 4-epimerase GalE [Planctomycetaceae bacterium]|jgi:UDP-glucose 4-epimerase|nr:UDP-glucose 4-epimerase GalE [Planctomycetaceae bacterium]